LFQVGTSNTKGQNVPLTFLVENDLFQPSAKFLLRGFCPFLGLSVEKSQNFSFRTIKSRFSSKIYIFSYLVCDKMALYLCRVVTLDSIWINVVAIKRQIRLAFLWKYFCETFFAFFSRILRWKFFGFHRTLKYGTWILERSLYLIKFIFVVFLVMKMTKFLKNFQIFTFVIIPDVPWRKNFVAFRAFVRSLPLETKLVLTRVDS